MTAAERQVWPSVKHSIAQTHFRGRDLSGTWPLPNAHKLRVPALVIGGRGDNRSPLHRIEASVDKPGVRGATCACG